MKHLLFDSITTNNHKSWQSKPGEAVTDSMLRKPVSSGTCMYYYITQAELTAPNDPMVPILGTTALPINPTVEAQVASRERKSHNETVTHTDTHLPAVRKNGQLNIGPTIPKTEEKVQPKKVLYI